ncbi:MAG: DegV family EDD domain-containing protein [Deltaproteobacteria bacterium]|nr:DegV family EDD domain-containing protein [Deltaproteobacteria bacterium]
MAKILVVEDDPDSALLVEACFSGTDHEVILVADPRNAVQAASHHHIDAVILDIMMPEASGFDVLSGLRSQAVTENVPVLVLSSLADSESRVQGLRLGAADYLSKPFDPDELRLRIENLIATHSPEEAGLEGRLEDFPFWELLQSLQQSARSGLLTLREKKARLAVHQGQVAAAAYGSLSGREAALAMSALEKGRFKFAPPEEGDSIGSHDDFFSVRGLLMEAALLRDELARREHFLPDPTAPLYAKPVALPPLPEAFEDVPVGRIFLELVQSPRVTLTELRERLSLCHQKVDLSVAWLLETSLVRAAPKSGKKTPESPGEQDSEKPTLPQDKGGRGPSLAPQGEPPVPLPILILLDPDDDRRQGIARGLSRFRYEVVPGISSEEGAAYLKALTPSILVLPSEWVSHPDLAPFIHSDIGKVISVIAMGDQEQERDLPRWIQFLSRSNLTPASFLERLRLLLLGRELGVDVDAKLESLVGELSQNPLPELLRDLRAARASGWLELPSGVLYLSEGELFHAAASPAEGIKAFCRLSRMGSGPFHFRPGKEPATSNLELTLSEALVMAETDSRIDLPDPRTRIQVEMGPRFFSTRFTPAQQQILSAAHDGATVGPLLDQLEAPDGEILQELLRLEQLGLASLEEPVDRVCILTDSTADLPEGEARRLGIQVIPLRVTFGEESFHDGLELTARGFYERLEAGPHHPFTTPPSREEFAHRYLSILPERDIVSLHISEHIPSETVVHARKAAEQALARLYHRRRNSDLPVLKVVDSRQTSAPLGVLAIFAARMALKGLSAEEITTRIDRISDRLHTFFVVDTLDYLARGGRIGKASAWMGKILDIKPILGLTDGRIAPVDKVRGGRRAQRRLLDLFQERLDGDGPCFVCVGHAKAPKWADRLASLMVERFEVTESFVAEMGPVIGTHVGPGTVGAVVFQPEGDELELLSRTV